LLALGGFSLPAEDTESAHREYVEDYERTCLGRGNSTIFGLMAQHVHADIAWLQDNGVELLALVPPPPTRVLSATVAPGPFVGMPRLFRALRAKITELGGVFAFDTKAKELIMDTRGAVVGVRAAGRDGLIDYRSRSVVIATGGYAGNKQFLEAWSDPNA